LRCRSDAALSPSRFTGKRDERFKFVMSSARRNRGRIHPAVLALSSWREWSTRHTGLRNAEVETVNLAQPLVQHADDTFELTGNILIGLVYRLHRALNQSKGERRDRMVISRPVIAPRLIEPGLTPSLVS
jgi:hypothetical protein